MRDLAARDPAGFRPVRGRGRRGRPGRRRPPRARHRRHHRANWPRCGRCCGRTSPTAGSTPFPTFRPMSCGSCAGCSSPARPTAPRARPAAAPRRPGAAPARGRGSVRTGASTPLPPGPAAAMVPELLGGIDRVRREAVTSVARYVHRSLRAMYPRADRQWAWDLLGELIYSRHRPAFDQLLEDTAQAVAALERARHLPSVAVVRAAAAGRAGDPAALRRVPLRRWPCPDLPARARRTPRSAARAASAAGRRAPPADRGRRAPRRRAPRARRAALAHRPAAAPPSASPRPATSGSSPSWPTGSSAWPQRPVRSARCATTCSSSPRTPRSPCPTSTPPSRWPPPSSTTRSTAPTSMRGRRLDRMADELAAACPTLVPTAEHEAAVRALRAHDAAGLRRRRVARSAPPVGRRRTRGGSGPCSTGCRPTRHGWPPPGSSSPRATPPRSASCACGRSRRCSPRCRSPTAPTSSSCSVPTRSASSGSWWPPRPRARRRRAARRAAAGTPTALSVLERAAAPVIRGRVAAGATSSRSAPARRSPDARVTGRATAITRSDDNLLWFVAARCVLDESDR